MLDQFIETTRVSRGPPCRPSMSHEHHLSPNSYSARQPMAGRDQPACHADRVADGGISWRQHSASPPMACSWLWSNSRTARSVRMESDSVPSGERHYMAVFSSRAAFATPIGHRQPLGGNRAGILQRDAARITRPATITAGFLMAAKGRKETPKMSAYCEDSGSPRRDRI